MNLKKLDWILPLHSRALPQPVQLITEAFTKRIQVEDGIVFWVLHLLLKALHDFKEGLKRSADVHDCGEDERH